jgi:hypothetical protein
MKATLFIFLILGAVFFFAGNQVLTVGDLVLVLVIFWLWHWQAKKRVKEQEDRRSNKGLKPLTRITNRPQNRTLLSLMSGENRKVIHR